MNLREVDAKVFTREVIRADLPVLVHFIAPACAQSRPIKPLVEKLAKEMPSDVKVVAVNSGDKKLLARLGVSRFPTQMLFVDGHKVDQILGATTEASLRGMIKTGIALRQKARATDTSSIVVDANFGRHVLQSEAPVLAMFFTKSCAASMTLLEHINEAAGRAKRIKTRLKIMPIDVERTPEVAARFQIKRLPTTLVFENGAVVDTLGGALSPRSISKLLKAYA